MRAQYDYAGRYFVSGSYRRDEMCIRDRRIVGGLLGTRSDTYRMRVHDRILEKRLEPVRVAVLGLAQVAVCLLYTSDVYKRQVVRVTVHVPSQAA